MLSNYMATFVLKIVSYVRAPIIVIIMFDLKSLNLITMVDIVNNVMGNC